MKKIRVIRNIIGFLGTLGTLGYFTLILFILQFYKGFLFYEPNPFIRFFEFIFVLMSFISIIIYIAEKIDIKILDYLIKRDDK